MYNSLSGIILKGSIIYNSLSSACIVFFKFSSKISTETTIFPVCEPLIKIISLINFYILLLNNISFNY